MITLNDNRYLRDYFVHINQNLFENVFHFHALPSNANFTPKYPFWNMILAK